MRTIADTSTEPTADELAYHLGGLAMLGEIPPLDRVPSMPAGHPHHVVAAVVAVYQAERIWPVDLGLVADVLREREQWWAMGGAYYVVPMMETCRTRMDRARELGKLLACAVIASKHLDAASATEDELFRLADQRRREREQAEEAIALLETIVRSAA